MFELFQSLPGLRRCRNGIICLKIFVINRKEQIYIERLYDFSEAGKIQLIRSKGQLLSEEYVPEGIEVKAYVPQDIYGRL